MWTMFFSLTTVDDDPDIDLTTEVNGGNDDSVGGGGSKVSNPVVVLFLMSVEPNIHLLAPGPGANVSFFPPDASSACCFGS